jgi:hypothetical protein
VTNAQYAEFLNAKASLADPHGLWNQQMGLGYPDGGISRSGFGASGEESGLQSRMLQLAGASEPFIDKCGHGCRRFIHVLLKPKRRLGDVE